MHNQTNNPSTIDRLAKLAQSRSNQTIIVPNPIFSDISKEPAPPPKARIRFLAIIPWVLSCTFVVSFFYDFDEITVTVFKITLQMEGLIRILSISGMIGFLTNWVAIIMLFRPQTKRPLLGQGLVPAQKKIIAEKLSNAVNNNLINPQQIKAKLIQSGILGSVLREIESGISSISHDDEFKDELFKILSDSTRIYLSDPNVRESITIVLLEHLEQSFTDKTIEKYVFKLYRNVRKEHLTQIIDKAITTIPDTIYSQRNNFSNTLQSIPEELNSHSLKIEEFLISGIDEILHRIDLKSLIEENLNRFDEGKLEELIKSSTIDQLNYIKYLGSVLGILGGFVIWNPIVSILILGSITVLFFILDTAIFNLKKN
jgi:uncharacterized membrane-anchored protein YjiN (DUF445 family)